MEDFERIVTALERDKSIASIFGVILYTDSHPYIKKVMRDEDYWNAFNEITGEKFTVLSVKPKAGRLNTPSFPPGSLGHMVPIWKEPRDNYKLVDAFELQDKDTSQLPLLLIFTRVKDDVLKIEISITEQSVDSAYNSIKDSLEFCSKVIAGILPENLNNPEGLYASFSLQNDHRVRINKIKNCLKLYTFIKGLIP